MVDRIGQPGATIARFKNGKTNHRQSIEADHITDAIGMIEELEIARQTVKVVKGVEK